MPAVKKQTPKRSRAFFEPDELDALRTAVKALEQKADSIASFGPFASKGPIMRNRNAAAMLRSMLRWKQ